MHTNFFPEGHLWRWEVTVRGQISFIWENFFKANFYSLLFSKAKVNNNSQVGVAYTQRLRDGIKLTLSSLIDTKNLNQGGHKIGLGLDMEAWEVGSELFSYNKTTAEWSSVYWNLIFFSFSVRKLLLYRANALRAKICVKSGMHAIDLFWINFKVTCCFLIPSVVLWIFWYY